MNPEMVVLSFDPDDSDAKYLGTAFDIPVIGKADYDSFSLGKPDLITINWGTYWQPELYRGIWINYPGNVRNACRKEIAFSLFKKHGIPHSPFTFDRAVAIKWNKDSLVVGRDTLKGRRSQGMTCYSPGALTKEAVHLAYAKGVDTKREYRFHIFGNKVIHTMEKVKDEELFPKAVRKYGNKANEVRSSMYGWHYSSAGLARNPPNPDCAVVAMRAVACLGLDFGAVDIAEKPDGSSAVFEVNTAPDLFGRNGTVYANAIKQYVMGVI